MTPTLTLELGPSLKDQDKRLLSLPISPVQKLSNESHLVHRTQALKLPPPGLALPIPVLPAAGVSAAVGPPCPSQSRPKAHAL